MGEAAEKIEPETTPSVPAQAPNQDIKHQNINFFSLTAPDDLGPNYFEVKTHEEGLFKLLTDIANGKVQHKYLQHVTGRYLCLFPFLEYFHKYPLRFTQKKCQDILHYAKSPEDLKSSPILKDILTDPTVVARFEKNSRNPVYKLGIPKEVQDILDTRTPIGKIRSRFRQLFMSNSVKAA